MVFCNRPMRPAVPRGVARSVGGSATRAREAVRKLKKTFRRARCSGIAQEQMRKTAQTFSRCSALAGACARRHAAHRADTRRRHDLRSTRRFPHRHVTPMPPTRRVSSRIASVAERAFVSPMAPHVRAAANAFGADARDVRTKASERIERCGGRQPAGMRPRLRWDATRSAASAKNPTRHLLAAASLPRCRFGWPAATTLGAPQSAARAPPPRARRVSPIRAARRTGGCRAHSAPCRTAGPPAAPQTKTGRTRRPVRLSRKGGSAQWPSSSSSSA